VIAGICPRCGGEVSRETERDLADTMLYRDDCADSAAAAECSPEAAGKSREKSGEESARERAGPSGGEPPAPTVPADVDRLLGDELHVYRCDLLLGSGGMGRVYLAQHLDLERKCALKILSPRALRHDIDYVDRFRHEGRAAAALIHPNVITIHAIGEARGYHFLEMEFVTGRTLQHLVDDEGRQTPMRATIIALRIAEAMAAAHQRGIIHRDLKLDNVLLTHQGVPKIADFGLAKRVRVPGAGSDDLLVGTPHYMAPELFTGQAADPQSDVYALGVCYYVLLTGRLPYAANSLSELKRLVAGSSPPEARQINPAIPLEMAECLGLLMSRAAANRPASAAEAAQLLHAVAGDLPEIESLLRDAFGDSEHVRWRRVDGKFHVEVQLPNGRRQTVIVERSKDASADRVVILSSVCGPAKPEFLEHALRLNAEIAHGSIAVREIDGEPTFVILNTYPAATVDVEEIHRTVLQLAHYGDAFEMLLSPDDRH